MTQKVLFLSQKFPWFRQAEPAGAKAGNNRQFWLLHTKRFELARQIAVAYYELGYVEKGLEINDHLKSLWSSSARLQKAAMKQEKASSRTSSKPTLSSPSS